MGKLLSWDDAGKHFYETGIEWGVLYPYDSSNEVGKEYGPGVAWNGLTSVSESPSGAEANAIYADNVKYLNLYSAEEFACTIEAYTYPEEFEACDGSAELVAGVKGVNIGQQSRKTFGFCYRTRVGNDEDGDRHGYKLHLIYGCMASPSEKGYQTINDSPEAITFSWEINTTPVDAGSDRKTSTLIIDSTKLEGGTANPGWVALETALYGVAATGGTSPTAEVAAYLPLPTEVIGMFTVNEEEEEDTP